MPVDIEAGVRDYYGCGTNLPFATAPENDGACC